MTAPRALVLGVGNILMQDEGVGVRTVEWLQARYAFTGEDGDAVEMLDGGTMGLDLMAYLEGVDRLLILDAVDAGKEPGELIELRGEAVPSFLGRKLSPHQIGVQDLLAAVRLVGCAPSEVVILGVQPEQLRVGLEMSPVVAAQVEPLARLAVAPPLRHGAAGRS
ncbi:MAG: HyaD/HybD family hydrogenase maturation endopeptidase, partial [Anaerolineales bacterium]